MISAFELLGRRQVRVVVAVLAAALLACSENHAAEPDEKDAATGDKDSGPSDPPGKLDGGQKPPPKPDAGKDIDADVPDHDAGKDADVVVDASDPDADVEPDAEVDASEPEPPLTLGGLTVDTTEEDQEAEIDLFGVWGHRFWIEVSDAQLERINNQGQYGGGGGYGDIYVPGGSNASYADHVLLQNATTGHVADYGKTEVWVIGQSTYRPWTKTSIPNVRIDTDEFTMGKRIGGFEHIRLNNSLGLDQGQQTGTMFREQVVYRIYREMGYPAPRSGYAFLGSSVWGEDVWVPMTMTEVYKRKFCEDNQEALGGTCEYIWEFYGDIAGGGGYYPYDEYYYPGPDPGGGGIPAEWCQVAECDNTRLEDFMEVLSSTPRNAGFRDAIAEFIDWPLYHQFQCLSWILQTSDDPIHAQNNVVLVLRDDGKFIYEPYSVDLSIGYDGVPLTGNNSISDGCQKDPACWADMMAVCDDVVNRFDELDPEKFVDQAVDGLTELGMMRSGDEDRAAYVRDWLVNRQTQLPDQIERYRYLPDGDGNCPDGMEMCGDGGCGTPEACELRQCDYGVWCESRQTCYEPQYENCPSCPEETPFYCDNSGECIVDRSECGGGYCPGYPPGYVYCQFYGECVPYQQCPNPPDEDAGVDDPGVAGSGGPIGAAGTGPIPFPMPGIE